MKIIYEKRIFMYCQKCGEEITGNSLYCPYCGNRVTVATQQDNSTQKEYTAETVYTENTYEQNVNKQAATMSEDIDRNIDIYEFAKTYDDCTALKIMHIAAIAWSVFSMIVTGFNIVGVIGILMTFLSLKWFYRGCAVIMYAYGVYFIIWGFVLMGNIGIFGFIGGGIGALFVMGAASSTFRVHKDYNAFLAGRFSKKG